MTEIVSDRHASVDFIGLLEKLDVTYLQAARIRILLDNHSAHSSKQTRAWLSLHPQRFEFVFTPRHGSWLNIIETLFCGSETEAIAALLHDAIEDQGSNHPGGRAGLRAEICATFGPDVLRIVEGCTDDEGT